MTPLRLTVVAALAFTLTACGGGDPSTSAGPTADPSGTAIIGASSVTTPPPAATTTAAAATTTAAQPPAEALPASWKLCQNQLRGSSMGYPGDWFTTSLGASDQCSMFHPSAFTIPANAGTPRVALNAFQLDTTPAKYLADTTDPMFFTTVVNEATAAIAGKSARKFEVTSTGQGLDESGTRYYGYIIDRGGKAFVLYTVAKASESQYSNWKFVVDTAKGTLRFL